MKQTIETEIAINKRIEKINEAVAELKKLKSMSFEQFLADKTVQYAAMFAMVIGIEAICDIGSHILAKFFNRSAETYKDIIICKKLRKNLLNFADIF